MGCTWSGSQPQDGSSGRSFKVINVDDHGQERNPGRIEISESELIWYQRNKEPIRWPLNSLRRYGFDAELFSFECGRRCPTGPGIYAFKCRQAEALFNLLQESVQRQRTGQDETAVTSPVLTTATIPAAHQPLLHSNSHSTSNGNAFVIGASRSAHRVGEVTSAGRESGAGGGSPLYVNEDVNCHEYINTKLAPQPGSSRQDSVAGPGAVTVVVPPSAKETRHAIQYAELDLPATGDNASIGDTTPVHVPNGTVCPSGGDAQPSSQQQQQQQAMYINIPANEIKRNACGLAGVFGPSGALCRQPSKADDALRGYANVSRASVPCSMPTGPRMNYAQLDLLSSSDSVANGSSQSPVSPVSSSNPESPTRRTDSYAMIDIERTQALNNRLKNTDDEGSRKTRHNSNIEELL